MGSRTTDRPRTFFGVLRRLVVPRAALGVLVTIAASLSWMYARWFPFELLTHFQAQYFGVSLVLLVVLLLCGAWRWALVALVAAVVSGAVLLPLSPLGASGAGGGSRAAHAAETPDGSTLRLFMANVMTSNRRADDLIARINEADPALIVLLETDAWWMNALEALTERWPFVVRQPRSDNFGIMVLSRLELTETEIITLAGDELPTVLTTVTWDGLPVRLAATHPVPPTGSRALAWRDEHLRDLALHLADEQWPVIITGDLNATPWTGAFRELCTALSLRDARIGHGLHPTWPATLPVFMRIPIDHVLVPPMIDVVAMRTGAAFGSDHLPVITDLRRRSVAR